MLNLRGALVALVVGTLLAACTSAPSAPSGVSASPTVGPSVSAGDRDVLLYTALGDSLASETQDVDSYVGFYARHLRRTTGDEVVVTNLGRPGWTSAQLRAALETDDRFRTAVSTADIVTWDIGGNDLLHAAIRDATGTCDVECLDATVDGFADNWDAIVDELVALRRDDAVLLRTFDLYEPFIGVRGGRRDVLVERLGQVNAIIRATDGVEGIGVARVASEFSREPETLVSDDGLHPSAAGHLRIADLLHDLGLEPIR